MLASHRLFACYLHTATAFLIVVDKEVMRELGLKCSLPILWQTGWHVGFSDRAAVSRDAAAELDRIRTKKAPVPGSTPNSVNNHTSPSS